MTKLARFYIKLEGIRSFIDGNGRTGRLLINLELMKTAMTTRPEDKKQEMKRA